MSEELMYGSSLKGMRTALKETLIELARSNEKVVVIDCETGTATNILPFKKEFPDRFIELGVAEQNSISFAFGVAASGYIPIVPLFGSFLTRRACDQIFIQVGYAKANIKLIGCYSGLTSPNTGATHQSINDISIMRSIPGIKIIEACNESELREAIIKIVEIHGPVYLRMIRGDIEPYESMDIPLESSFEIGKASILREGCNVTLIGCGLMVKRCLEAADFLAQNGISAEVLNCSTIKPLDEDTILKSAAKTKAVVTAENHSVIGGLGSAVAESISENCPVPTRRIGIMDRFGESGSLEELFPKYRLSTHAVLEAVKIVLLMKSNLAGQ
jgi:transketolase